jgi:hypothetical protein
LCSPLFFFFFSFSGSFRLMVFNYYTNNLVSCGVSTQRAWGRRTRALTEQLRAMKGSEPRPRIIVPYSPFLLVHIHGQHSDTYRQTFIGQYIVFCFFFSFLKNKKKLATRTTGTTNGDKKIRLGRTAHLLVRRAQSERGRQTTLGRRGGGTTRW